MPHFTRTYPTHALAVALMLSLLWIVGWAVPTPVAARGTVTLLESTATATFGSDVTFTLDARSATAIAEVDLLYGSGGNSYTIVPLPITPAPRVQVQHRLDPRIFYLPPGVDLTYYWLIRDQDGNEYASERQSVTYMDTRFAWQERSERNVTVYWYQGNAAFGEELLGTAVRTVNRMEAELGTPVSAPIKIFMYASGQDMRGALRANSVEWVGGQAFPGLGIIIGVAVPGNISEVRRIVPHELSHIVLHHILNNPYGGWPLWFDEGLAVYHQETPDIGFDTLLNDAARNNTLIPLEALAASFPTDTNRALLSYAQSHSMVVYIIETYGVEKLQELAAAFRAATPVAVAIEQVFGMSLDELDSAWRSTLPAPERAAPPLEGSPSRAPADRFSASTPSLPTPHLGNSGFFLLSTLLVPVLIVTGVGLLRRMTRPTGDDPVDGED